MSIPSFSSPLRRRLFLGLSPWLILGGAVVLGLSIAALSIGNIQKGHEHMVRNLADRADSIIWTVEVGTRTKMIFSGGSRRLQTLVEETSKQAGIKYIAMTTADGRILAHSDRRLLDEILHKPDDMATLGIGEEAKWRMIQKESDDIFEVYKIFSPAHELIHKHRRPGQESGAWRQEHKTGQDTPTPIYGADENILIFVGVDMKPLERARAADLRRLILTALVVALLALGGFVSIFLAHNYRLSRRLLKDTQAFATAVVNSLPVGLLTSDADGKIALANQSAANILGMEQDKLINASLTKLGGPDWNAIFMNLKRDATILDLATDFVSGQGEKIPVSLSASSVINKAKIFLGHLFILRDLREVKKLQEQLQRNERLSALGHLAAGVAHEIRNPLSSIKGLAIYLAGRQKELADKDAAALMAQEVNRLDLVVSELLEFAKPSRMNFTEQDINQVIERALRLCSSDLSAQGVETRFQPTPLPLVHIDAERLTQALLNLFLNAVQAMEAGGTLSVGVTMKNEDLTIQVTDTGSGISEESLREIFNPYVTSKPYGTGLGLPIVHRIVEGHGGKIKVESKKGRGTTVTILLPVRPRSEK